MKLKKPWKPRKSEEPKHRLIYLDPPRSVQPTTLALSMAAAATVASAGRALGVDLSTVTTTIQVGADTMRFQVVLDEGVKV